MSETYVIHVSTNDATATRISFALRDAGIGTWIDHIHGTEHSAEETQDALQRCQSGLLLLSEDSLYSRKCAHEWQAILDQKKPLYVALLETVPSDDLPAPLWDRSIPYIDLTYDVEHGLVKLVQAITGTVTRN